MGSTSKNKGIGYREGDELFSREQTISVRRGETLPLETAALKMMAADRAPAQTDAKSRLIASYISKFQIITRGGLYIDGFAGPQKREFADAWTARRVLEIQPPRLRTFWLCDNDPEGLRHLYDLKAKHHKKAPSRRVFVYEGDFNQSVSNILSSGRIKQRSAVFALLDQRNTECHWATVQALAAFKGRTRIELLYFLGVGWLHRSLTQSKRPERLDEIDRWWGNRGWTSLTGMSQIQMQNTVAERFQVELGYRHVNWWPVFLAEHGAKTAFALIHATDHEDAPKLMRRAYEEIYGFRPGSPTDGQGDLFDK